MAGLGTELWSSHVRQNMLPQSHPGQGIKTAPGARTEPQTLCGASLRFGSVRYQASGHSSSEQGSASLLGPLASPLTTVILVND